MYGYYPPRRNSAYDHAYNYGGYYGYGYARPPPPPPPAAYYYPPPPPPARPAHPYYSGYQPRRQPLPIPPVRPMPLEVAKDVDTRFPVKRIELVHRFSASLGIYLYSLLLHVDYDDHKTYCMDVFPSATRSVAPPYPRYGVWHVYRRDEPVRDDLVMRRAVWRATGKTGGAWHSTETLLQAMRDDKAHLCEFKGDGRDDGKQMLEWCLKVLRLWGKKGYVVIDEAGLKLWKHVEGPQQ